MSVLVVILCALVLLGVGAVTWFYWNTRRKMQQEYISSVHKDAKHTASVIKGRISEMQERGDASKKDIAENNVRIERIRLGVENRQRGRYRDA